MIGRLTYRTGVRLRDERLKNAAARLHLNLLTGAELRTAVLVFGGLATLQSSQSLDGPKLLYLLVATAAFASALLAAATLRATRTFRSATPLLIASAAFGFLVALSLPAAYGQGTALTAWLRDATGYLLFASVPVFALDLRAGGRRRVIMAMFLLAGALAAFSFAIEWTGRRGLAEVFVDRIVLPSFLLPAALLSLAVSEALRGGTRRTAWAGLAALLLALVLVTGTRSGLLLLLAPLAIVLAASESSRARILRLVLITGLAVVAIAVLLAGLELAGRQAAADRLQSLPRVALSPREDQSFVVREGEHRAAFEALRSQPLLGVGPGYVFQWPNPFGSQKLLWGTTLDTGFGFVAKFGLLGLAVLLGAVLAYTRFTRQVETSGVRASAWSALIGFGVVAVGFFALGSPFEDKGLGFGLVFLLALALPPPDPDRMTGDGVADQGEAEPDRPMRRRREYVTLAVALAAGAVLGAAVVGGAWLATGREHLVSQERAKAELYARQWAFYNCGPSCDGYDLRRVAPSLWELEVDYEPGRACYALNPETFERAGQNMFRGVSPIRCAEER